MEHTMLKRANDFTTPKLLRDPAEVVIPRLADDPQYAEATTLLSNFTDRLDWLRREKDRVDLDHYLSGREVNPKSETDRSLRARLALLNSHAAAAPVALAAPDAPSPAIALALSVLAGQPVAPVLDHKAQIAEIWRQIDAIEAAIREQNEVCENIAGELTLRYAKQIKPAWDQVQIEWYRAAQELARQTKRVHQLRAAITAAGIRSRSDVLAMPNVRSPLMLGDETNWNSEIAGWRRILEKLGILG
jgi:hypothetical protein